MPDWASTKHLVLFLLSLSIAACDRATDRSATPAKAAIPLQARDAVVALKKLEARTQTGITYDDYLKALGEARFAVNLFADSEESKKFQTLREAVQNIMSDYQFAGDVWKMKLDRAVSPRDIGVPAAVRTTDAEGKDILGKLPNANKAMDGELLKQRKANEIVAAKKLLGVASPTDQLAPPTPTKSDGAVFEKEGYADAQIVGRSVFVPKGAQKTMIQYLDLEVVFRLIWLRAAENLAKTYGVVERGA